MANKMHSFKQGDAAHSGYDGPRAVDRYPMIVVEVNSTGKTVTALMERMTGDDRVIVFRFTTRKRGGSKFRSKCGLVLTPGHDEYNGSFCD